MDLDVIGTIVWSIWNQRVGGAVMVCYWYTSAIFIHTSNFAGIVVLMTVPALLES